VRPVPSGRVGAVFAVDDRHAVLTLPALHILRRRQHDLGHLRHCTEQVWQRAAREWIGSGVAPGDRREVFGVATRDLSDDVGGSTQRVAPVLTKVMEDLRQLEGAPPHRSERLDRHPLRPFGVANLTADHVAEHARDLFRRQLLRSRGPQGSTSVRRRVAEHAGDHATDVLVRDQGRLSAAEWKREHAELRRRAE